MKTPEEIKKGLECCVVRLSCEGCPYYTGDPSCLGKMRKDLFFLIQQLERERDAAVECMRGACYLCIHTYPGVSYLSGSDCAGCKYNGVEYDGEDNWQWRGVQEVE